jgi:hypothetical protein
MRWLLSADRLDEVERKYVNKPLADEEAKERISSRSQNDD